LSPGYSTHETAPGSNEKPAAGPSLRIAAGLFSKLASEGGEAVDEAGRPAVMRLYILALAAMWLAGAVAAQAGPCTAQITKVERQIRRSPPGPTTGPTAAQSVGAQLHHQPTPGTVQSAEAKAQADAAAALNRARKADAAGDTVACAKALAEAKAVYGLD
jgi:hypothetical protein